MFMPNLSIASHVSRYLHPDFLRQRLSALSEDDRTLIQEYLTTLALRNYSPDTVYCHITTWVTFLRAAPHASLRTLTVRDVEQFIEQLQDQNRHPSTINGHLSTLSSFYRYLIEQDPAV